MKVLEELLENYWIINEQDNEKYEQIRQELDEKTLNFIKQKLGYKLIVNPYLIKLEKIPGIPQEFMGIKEFNTKLEYVFLCLILIFLEEKSRKEQFILSQLVDYIQSTSMEINLGDVVIYFNLFKQRQAMVRVLKYIRDLGFIKLYDGDENKFADNVENDVLYEVTGVSKYFVRNFTSNISDCNLYTDIYEQEQLGLDQEKGIERRQRVYRRLFTENIVYNEKQDDQDYMYIKQYKNIISQDVDQILDSSLEIHKNGAYILLTEHEPFKNVFPTNKAISDVVIFFNTLIIEKFENGKLINEDNDTILISEIEFSKVIYELKEKYGRGFSKEYREMNEEELEKQIVEYMKEFDMIRKEDKEFRIMPIIFKIKGRYPINFNTGDEV